MSDLNKIFQKVIEIDERKNNSLSNVTQSLMDLEIGEMARQAAERDMFPERDDLTPVNMSNENFAEKTFDPAYQQSLQALWNLAGEETTIEDHEYLDRTVLGKKIVTNYFDEFEEFITYDYLGNKSKNVTIT